jgi:hypothetical protein
MCLPGLGRPAQRLEEEGGGEPGENAHDPAEDDPSTKVGEQLRLFTEIEPQEAPQR